MTTRGVLYVHSAPRAMCPHVEWAVAGVLGLRVQLDWIRQPASPGTWRSEFSWRGEAGTASKLASALRGWQMLRFEVTAEPSPTAEGERYSATPSWASSTPSPVCTATSWSPRTGCAPHSPGR